MSVSINALTSDGSLPRAGLAALAVSALTLAATEVRGASPVGVWLTPADRKGQVAHVVSEPCGSYFCGTIARVFDQSGTPVAAPTVGQRVFWNMAPDGDAFRGRAYVPAHNREYAAQMEVSGDLMTVSGCLGPVCQSQVWQRVD
ncbi:DUF2147 domain-containing protein [Tateyamaria sp. SN3-11]|uniref:DUF2147 domain-containing protein n=1 Tax=Tateyamaria sp. SN3-11 TaxID=3092147 RepID=UPI0039EA7D4A